MPLFELVKPRFVPWAPLLSIWVLSNEFSALQSLLLVELVLLPSLWRVIYEHAAPCWAGSSLSFWGMSSPLSRAHGWVCRSFLSGGVPSHSEEWVFRSSKLCGSSLALIVELALLSAPQSSVIGRRLVELALLPPLRGSPMSMPLPSERLKILRNEFSAPQSSVVVRSPCWSR